MIASIQAAFFADRKRPGVWYITATWLVLALVFGIGIPFAVYQGLSGDPAQRADAESLLEVILPAQLVPTGIGLFPLFGGAVSVVLGALVIGNEYRWGTFNLLFTQRPRRGTVIAGHAVALLALTLGLVVATLLVVAGGTAVVAAVEGRSIDWPPPGAILRTAAAAWLICSAHAGFGFLLAIAFRSTATAISVGLLWTMLLENAVSALALVLDPFVWLQKVLLAPSSGALAGALGARSQFDGGTPGVVESATAWQPALVLGCYIAATIGASIYLASRRDVK
jgi:ABC-type transport system involved in multi-copper enzyme maturation permease subunit